LAVAKAGAVVILIGNDHRILQQQNASSEVSGRLYRFWKPSKNTIVSTAAKSPF
jgi:hypothetical protein